MIGVLVDAQIDGVVRRSGGLRAVTVCGEVLFGMGVGFYVNHVNDEVEVFVLPTSPRCRWSRRLPTLMPSWVR
jgi:hypothetical protein